MLLKSPKNIQYPITITELHRQHKEPVALQEPLLTYSYVQTIAEQDRFGDVTKVQKTFYGVLESEATGTIESWRVHPHDTIRGPGAPLVEVKEACAHEIQFGGMCANCGEDMTQVNYLKRADTDRATISIAHSNPHLTVSQNEARRVEDEAKRRLLATRKLSLVVDLDQTIIHATVDPTVSEWQRDETNPNHAAVKDVKAFQLVDDQPSNRECWYYIKLRPGLLEFLENVSEMYELHIYTMGTRAYAQNIANIVDPDRKIFGDRILSRDESGSLTVKNLHRIFPVDTKMVVVIDDRGDVWNWSNNLIKVPPYDFFVGIGDINSSFLPKRTGVIKKEFPPVQEEKVEKPETEADTETATETGEETNENGTSPEPVQVNGNILSIEQQIVAMGGGNDPKILEQQTHKQDEAIHAQIVDRPLLQKQMKLDKADEEAEKQAGGDYPHPEQKQRHNLLHDDDAELQHLEAALRRLHEAFFDEYERRNAGPSGKRIAELKNGKSFKRKPGDLVPDVANIMPLMKQEVLRGVSLVFTGVVPLGTDIQFSDIALWAKSYGAKVSDHITKKTTHVIAAKNRRTAKARQAARHSKIKIVAINWLFECFSRWERVDEARFIIHVEPDEHGPPSQLHGSPPLDELEEGTVLSSSEEDAAVTESEGDGFGLAFGEDEDEDDLLLPESAGLLSPTKEEWESMGAEVDAFMNESDSEDDDDDASVRSESSVSSRGTDTNQRKRKRGDESVESSDADDSDASVGAMGGSKLQRRKKRALERTSSLTNVASAKSSGLPSPDTTGPEEELGAEAAEGGDAGEAGGGGGTKVDFADDDDGLEAELMAEFEREDEEGDE